MAGGPRGAKWGGRALSLHGLDHTPAHPRLRAAFGIGFCILFAFIGTFTYVNFVLVRPLLSLGPMELGLVYFVFLPSVMTTLLAGRAVHRWDTRPTLWGLPVLAGIGLPLLLLPNLAAVLLGMVLIGVGTFFAQATATGFVSRAATLALVSRRQARQEDKHVYRFHRGKRVSQQKRLVRAGKDR